MPGIDGLEVCRRVRGDRSLARVPILFLTVRSADITDLAVNLNRLDGDKGPLTAYTFSFKTWKRLTGLATGDGCVPGGGASPAGVLLGLACACSLIRAGRRRSAGTDAA